MHNYGGLVGDGCLITMHETEAKKVTVHFCSAVCLHLTFLCAACGPTVIRGRAPIHKGHKVLGGFVDHLL